MEKKQFLEALKDVFSECQLTLEHRSVYALDDDALSAVRLGSSLAGIVVEDHLLGKVGDKIGRIVACRQRRDYGEFYQDSVIDAICYLAMSLAYTRFKASEQDTVSPDVVTEKQDVSGLASNTIERLKAFLTGTARNE